MNQLLDPLAANETVGAVAIAIGGTGLGLWLAAAWWTYTDMARRTRSELARLLAVAWMLLSTPLLFPFALGTYLLARPQLTVSERRAQRLFEAIEPSLDDGRCRACGTPVDPEWRRCPACASWLASACGYCGEWSATDLDTCPWCASDKDSTPGPAAPAWRTEPALAAIPIVPEPEVLDGTSPVLGAAGGSGRRVRSSQRPAAASAARRPLDGMTGNRGARDLRRTRRADQIAGSGRFGTGS